MKIIHLILAFLMAAIVRADSNQTYAFFARIKGTLKPLNVHEKTTYLFKTIVWGSGFPNATEFFYENGRAHPTYENKPTNIVIKISSGFQKEPKNIGSVLKLDEHSKVKNTFFFSCGSDTLGQIEVVKNSRDCFLVVVYFLPYNRTTNAPVEGSYIPEKEVEMIPYVFFIESTKGLEPLYLDTLTFCCSIIPPFRYGDLTVMPQEFLFQEDYVMTKGGRKSSYYLGFLGNAFTTDRNEGSTNLGLDKRMKLSQHRFFSCNTSKFPEREINLNPSAIMDCFEVDMYLLPYNKTSGRPMEGSYRPLNETIKSSESHNYPYVLFMKANGTMEPLSYRTRDDIWTGGNYGVFQYQKSQTKPVEFTLRNNLVHTRDKFISGYAGLINHELVFGGATVGVPFSFDRNMKIKDHVFFSCANIKSPATRDIVYDTSHRDTCVKIGIYLLPYNRTSGRPVDGVFGQDISMPETDSGSVHSNTTLPDVYKKPENDFEPKYPILPPDFPYVFHTKVNQNWVPLSTIFSYDNNATTLFSVLKSKEAPVEFFLKDGVAYTDINSTRKYAGIYSYFLGFGDFVTEHKFEFEGQMRIRNWRFYTCRHRRMSWDLIVSPKIPGANCRKLKIHLLPYNRTSKSPVKCRHMPQARANKNISSVSSCVSKPPRYMIEFTGTANH